MKRVMTAAAALWAALSGQAHAGPGDADLWIGFEGTQNGFLLDTDTGEAWMTGVCLRQIETARLEGDAWVSRNASVEMVGRTAVRLDQTFTLRLADGAGQVKVFNPDRGGVQTFAMVVKPCPGDAICAVVVAEPAC